MLILEGRVEVTVGRENLVYESGPFTHFGLQALAGINMSNIGHSFMHSIQLEMCLKCAFSAQNSSF